MSTVKISNAVNPDKNEKVDRYIFSEKEPRALFIPAGYANGFRSLEKNTKVIFFSTSSLEDSKNDDFRFPYDYWGKEVWDNLKEI